MRTIAIINRQIANILINKSEKLIDRDRPHQFMTFMLMNKRQWRSVLRGLPGKILLRLEKQLTNF